MTRCRWEDNSKVDLQELGWRGKDWIVLAPHRERSRAPVNAVNVHHKSLTVCSGLEDGPFR